MRPIHALLLAALSVLVLTAASTALHGPCSAGARFDEGSTLRVVGVGEASAAPDLVTLEISAETRASGPESAVVRGHARTRRLLEVLGAHGVAGRDIHVAQALVDRSSPRDPAGPPEGRRCVADDGCAMDEICDQGRCVIVVEGHRPAAGPSAGDEVLGFTLAVTLRDASRLPALLEALVAADDGVLRVQVRSDTVGDPGRLVEEARAAAIADARAQAEALAGGLGVALGPPIAIEAGEGAREWVDGGESVRASAQVSVTYRVR
ncbi:MAG: SIMPL domain-containing protein [Nannocystaceae bacterium]